MALCPAALTRPAPLPTRPDVSLRLLLRPASGCIRLKLPERSRRSPAHLSSPGQGMYRPRSIPKAFLTAISDSAMILSVDQTTGVLTKVAGPLPLGQFPGDVVMLTK